MLKIRWGNRTLELGERDSEDFRGALHILLVNGDIQDKKYEKERAIADYVLNFISDDVWHEEGQ